MLVTYSKKIWSNSSKTPFYHSDLDPMTLTLKLDLDMVKITPPYQRLSFYIKAFKSYSPNKDTDRQTDTHTHGQYETFPSHRLRR